MNFPFLILTMATLSVGCRTDNVLDTGEDCNLECPTGENLWEASDTPCSESIDADRFGACKVIEACGETIYCRTEGV